MHIQLRETRRSIIGQETLAAEEFVYAEPGNSERPLARVAALRPITQQTAKNGSGNLHWPCPLTPHGRHPDNCDSYLKADIVK